MLRRTLLTAAVLATLAVPQQQAGACDITKLKAQLTGCAEFWYEPSMLFMNGFCDLGYLMFCDLL